MLFSLKQEAPTSIGGSTFTYIIKHLLDADYIRKCIDCPYQITPKGIQYLECHEMMTNARLFCSNKKYDRKIYNNFVD